MHSTSFSLIYCTFVKKKYHEKNVSVDIYWKINTDYKHHDSDFHKGFLQGIIAASSNGHSDEPTLPNRYITAIKYLSSKPNNVISPVKGGGVVIMDSTVYNQNLMDLLDDNNTYEQISLQLQIILTSLKKILQKINLQLV